MCKIAQSKTTAIATWLAHVLNLLAFDNNRLGDLKQLIIVINIIQNIWNEEIDKIN